MTRDNKASLGGVNRLSKEVQALSCTNGLTLNAVPILQSYTYNFKHVLPALGVVNNSVVGTFGVFLRTPHIAH